MAYSNLSINELIKDITANKYYLPAIQRKFVWGEEKICTLFNSIMRNYPIGTFLFWDLSAEKANEYTFYEFLKNYHERDSKNELVRSTFTTEIRGVLDGQQRISSMYIALQGVYQTKKKYAKSADNKAYPERKFHMDLLGDENDYVFKFLSENEAMPSDNEFYFPVRDILFKPGYADPDEILEELVGQDPDKRKIIYSNSNLKFARKKISRLLFMFNESNLISYFKIDNKDLDDILDIFVRVNSGGAVLSKSDLLFSTLVAHWEDGRKEIERLIADMNGEDMLFSFNTDFLMRTCLFLVDAPMNFKVKTFDKTNIEKIHESWGEIRSALISAVKILREFGFNKARLSSNYAVTPVAYYLFKNGVDNKDTKRELHRLVTNSLLKQIYSGQADTALSALREGLRVKDDKSGKFELRDKRFSFDKFQHTKLSGGKRLTIDAQDIDDFLDHKKGAFGFLVLSILYPDLKLDQVSFHQDHMHPYSKFTASKLKDAGLAGIDTDGWLDMRNKLPNLQLLEGLENTQKQAENLSDWVKRKDENDYRKRNYIPVEQSLKMADFESFYKNRKAMLKESLEKKLLISQP
ncbi:MAG: hypothetical protein A6F72_09210 [Cycloclasticus sp. symbiont of Poecilosclerida sp. N]|nr:MAG: hypothetical protein A6F72_09210 [Cycloclasticus sp. symbiont of Poecilosclerida sp. N]